MKGLHSHQLHKIRKVSPRETFYVLAELTNVLAQSNDFSLFYLYVFLLGFHMAENMHPSKDVKPWSSPTSPPANDNNLAAKGWDPIQ